MVHVFQKNLGTISTKVLNRQSSNSFRKIRYDHKELQNYIPLLVSVDTVL